MNTLKYIFLFALLAVITGSCNKITRDTSFIDTAAAPDKLSALFEITQDNTGLVTITPNGEGASYFDVYFGDGTAEPSRVAAGSNVEHIYGEGTYNVKLVAYNVSGKTAEGQQSLTVSFRAPENLEMTADVDPSNNFQVNVSATADFETMFKVYFGEAPDEVPQTFLEGETASHVYAQTGTYTIRVVALSGGSQTTETTKTISIVNPILLPVTFESATIQYDFGDFDGGTTSVIDNPAPDGTNTSTKVAKMVKKAGQPWGGTSIALGGDINFANKIFWMKVYAPRAGARVLLKVENSSDASISYEVEATTTKAHQWEDISFDYSAVNTAQSYQHIVIIFDNGTMGDGSDNFTFLFDDIRLAPALAQIDLPVTFDASNVDYTVTDFGNNQSVDGVDPGNANNKVKITTKPTGAETWAGTTIGTPDGFASAVPLSASSAKMSMRVYAPAAGIPVRLKLEDHTDGSKSVETEVLTTVANAWETLIFDFTHPADGTPALNLAYTYDKASVFFDFNAPGSGKVFYWDDVKLYADNGSPALLINFESAASNYAFTNFDGGDAVVTDNPEPSGINTSSQVVRMIKNPGQTWGGSYLTLSDPIDFSNGKTFTMKVFSPRAGAKVLLKVENLTDGTISFEKEVPTTSANVWEELTFDYSAIDASRSYQKVTIIFDNGTMGDGSADFTYLFDDITLN